MMMIFTTRALIEKASCRFGRARLNHGLNLRSTYCKTFVASDITDSAIKKGTISILKK